MVIFEVKQSIRQVQCVLSAPGWEEKTLVSVLKLYVYLETEF